MIWCYGDSNTYGYDPRSFWGGRYSDCWPELLAKETGFQVINDGQNGRMIPSRDYELKQFLRDSGKYNEDVFAIMLGTNDLLNGATAREAASRMESFLKQCGRPHILLIAPPPMKRGEWVPDDQLVTESVELSRQYRAVSEKMGIWFADAGEWDVELAYDGVHFSEEGHRRFAKGIADTLRRLLLLEQNV